MKGSSEIQTFLFAAGAPEAPDNSTGLQLLDQLDPWIEELDRAVIKETESRPLDDAAGGGAGDGATIVLTIGSVDRFPTSKHVLSYLGLNPSEESSGGKQWLGAISKQGNSMTRYLLSEAAQTASRFDPELRRDYRRLKFRRGLVGWRKWPSHESWRGDCTGSRVK